MYLHTSATLSCDGKTLVPACSYCLQDDKNNVTENCDGNCKLNPNTRSCERRGKKRKMIYGANYIKNASDRNGN